MKKLGLALFATFLLLAAPLQHGCSSQTTTTTTRTVERPGDDGRIEKETTVTEAKDESGGGPTGILSTTVNAVGFLLALPFKLVAGLIEIIF